jgi:[ribosomal protein S5]-alanine N-acetyltransferase
VRLEVLPATADDLRQLKRGVPLLRGWRVEPGYLEFPEALDGALGMLADGVPPRWATYLFVERLGTGPDVLVGLGGFKGMPRNGRVEIGYGIAPASRGRGLATEAARLLVCAASASGVDSVRAHTLAHENPSTRVLRRNGFGWVREIDDPVDGPIWRWERHFLR